MSLFIIAGPSQGGKTTLINLLLKENNFTRIVTATSRKPRENEKDKIDYYFLKEEDFKDKSKFIEIAIVHGNYYGTLKSEIELKLKSKKEVLWNIDVQGVKFILEDHKELLKNFTTIFLTPDKLSLLLERIQNKNDSNMKERINSIKKEFSYLHFFKYLVNTSQNIEESLADLKAIMTNDSKRINKIEEFTKKFNVDKFLET